MATLIPTLELAKRRMETSGERRLADRLDQKLEDDYWVWSQTPVQNSTLTPDFTLLHPRHGVLVLEVKDWKLETIHEINPSLVTIHADGALKQTVNPIQQGRHYAESIARALGTDRALCYPEDHPRKGRLVVRWGYGAVLTNINRKDFIAADLGRHIPAHCVICKDEMLEDADPEVFQKRLWDMFPYPATHPLTLPQLDRIRWHIYPETRVQQLALNFTQPDGSQDVPDIVRVMDLQQEQLARSLGEGHRVVHGVAGSGKTLMLIYRAELIAKTSAKPVLVLCYNRALAEKLEALMAQRQLGDKVRCQSFQQWCFSQLRAYGIDTVKGSRPEDYAETIRRVASGIDRGQIPSGQYAAVLIDEGQDFDPQWIQIATRMVDPATNQLLLLYDDAQSIRDGKLKFTLSSAGVQARGRTTVLRVNYRNSEQILETARHLAGELLTPQEGGEDEAPRLSPIGAKRHGPKPVLLRLAAKRDERLAIANQLRGYAKQGLAWRDMAVLCRNESSVEELATYLAQQRIPAGEKAGAEMVTVITWQRVKGLEFPAVCICDLGYESRKGSSTEDEVRLLYVLMTRAMTHLVMTTSTQNALVDKVEAAVQACP